ncbi:MAG: metallophosphoesterase family protein [Eubacteriales bacterium]|nr:metallophosphoesterase family protein [Eubacteriales bacterium]
MMKVMDRNMSKVLFIADIHGNMPAVQALEKEIEKIQPDKIYFLGDAVGKGPENDQAVDWVRSHCDCCIKGNWDDGIVGSYRGTGYPGNDFYIKQLGKERIEWLEKLPFEDEVLISGLWFRLVHGRPTDRLYQAYDDWAELMQGFVSKVSDKTFNAYICADSHMPYIRTCGYGYAINTGSVGNSLGFPRVHAVLVEGELGSTELSSLRCEVVSIPYCNQAAADAADKYEDFPEKECWKKEVLTGEYSR